VLTADGRPLKVQHAMEMSLTDTLSSIRTRLDQIGVRL
jgi:hypothetical protein